jgi:hypothetical protein
MKWRPNSLISIIAAVVMLVIVGVIFIPGDPEPLALDDLVHVQLGRSFEEIAGEIRGEDWLSEAEFFTVMYDVEGDMQLLLIYEDGTILSGAVLQHPDGTTTTMGATSSLRSLGQ